MSTKTTSGKTASKAKKPATTKARTAAKKTKAAAGKTLRKTEQTVQKTIVQPRKEMETIMTQGTVQFEKLAKEAANSSKDQMDALMKSGSVFMKGFEDLTKTYFGLAQQTAEKNTQALKSLMSCKDVKELTEAQNKWAQQSFDDMMSGATKISEISVKLATDAFTPINDQMGKTIKKASETMAA